MRIQFFQHVPFEGLGNIEEWIKERGHSLNTTKFCKGEKLPALADLDCLIIMGGPMSVNDEKEYSWLKNEKQFIHQAIKQEKIIIGVCLGAQLIANVLGAKVYPNREKEIGWFPISFTTDAKRWNALNKLPKDYTVFHWHGDTFDLPKGATHLAFSEACKNQAFSYDKNVLGLQFHLETTKESLSQMIKHGRNELVTGKYIQSEKEILNQQSFINDNKKLLFALLDEEVSTTEFADRKGV